MHSPHSPLTLQTISFPERPSVLLVLEILAPSKYVWIFTDATLASNPYPNFLGALTLYEVTAIYSSMSRTKLLYNH